LGAWWGDRATTVAQYIRKGDAIDVTGEVSARAWIPQDSDEPPTAARVGERD
jgi:single-stranded DNA-binding protein